jgi:hydroxymethylpyrimidine pyrophosphatase-like HAD family hydrolase
MNKIIEAYITKNYYLLSNISERITKHHDLSKDLLHEVILQLYDKEEIILKSYDDNSIRYYITAILRTNFYSKTSPFYYRVRREHTLYVDLNGIAEMESDQESFEVQNIYDILEAEFSELNWFHKSLFEMYLTLGSLKKVSKKTTIPLPSISRYIKEARKEVKTKILKRLENED